MGLDFLKSYYLLNFLIDKYGKTKVQKFHRPIFIVKPRSGELINMIGRWHMGKLLDNKIWLVIFYFYSNYDPTVL